MTGLISGAWRRRGRGLLRALIHEGDLQRICSSDVAGGIPAIRPASHVDVGGSRVGAWQKIGDLSLRGAVCRCGNFIGGFAKLIVTRNPFAADGAVHDMEVGELFCKGHQSRFKDRQRPDTEMQLCFFFYTI